MRRPGSRLHPSQWTPLHDASLHALDRPRPRSTSPRVPAAAGTAFWSSTAARRRARTARRSASSPRRRSHLPGPSEGPGSDAPHSAACAARRLAAASGRPPKLSCTPAGKLSEAQIQKGQAVLAELAAAVEAGQAALVPTLSSEFYTLIPTTTGRKVRRAAAAHRLSPARSPPRGRAPALPLTLGATAPRHRRAHRREGAAAG